MISEDATFIILGGGQSKRMGQPKHLLPTSKGTIIEHLAERFSPLFTETMVVGRGLGHELPGLRIVEDMRKERTPLVGIYSGLAAAATDLGFVLACDMPFVKEGVVRYLLSCARQEHADVVVPCVDGLYEPLCAVYRKGVADEARRALDLGRLKPISIYPQLKVREVPREELVRLDPTLTSFTNLNTPKDLHLLSRLG